MDTVSLILAGIAGLFALYMVWLKVVAPKMAGVEYLSMQQYRDQFRKQSHLLLDVRTEGEFASGHAPRARLMPVDAVAKAGQQELTDLIKGKPVVCICASGNRSVMAATVLARHGFKPVYSLNGGMGAWRSAGMTVKRSV